MKKIFILLAALTVAACDRVEPGNVGVLVNLTGENRGVQSTLLIPGNYWIWSRTEQLYIYPTFLQNYTYDAVNSNASPTDDSINFQSVEGANINADIGIEFEFIVPRIPQLFERFRMGPAEITRVYLRNLVRDALVQNASSMTVESLIGAGRNAFMDRTQEQVKIAAELNGIRVINVSSVSQFRLPQAFQDAVNARIAASQVTEQRRQELQTVQLETQRTILRATAEAQANRLISESVTPTLIMMQAVQKWNGTLPSYMGAGVVPSLSLNRD